MKAIFSISLVLVLRVWANAQPGTLDQTFGISGRVLTDIDQTRNVTNSVLVQPNGKIVVVGYCTPVDYTGYFTLTRYNTDGSLDNEFGVNGVVTTSINGNEDIPFSGALQSDGKIIAAGYTWTGSDYDFAMVRYNVDGTRDTTFGLSGIVTTDFNGGNDKANQVIIGPGGDIFLIGFTGDAQSIELDMAVAKFAIDGNLKEGFGNGGHVTIPVSEPGLWDCARAAALQTDGKLVLVGFSDHYDQLNASLDLIFAATRLNMDGTLDPTFGSGGIVKMPIAKRAVATSVVITNDGKIVALAETKASKYGTTDFTLLRLNQSGTLDLTFGTGGMTTMSFDNSDDSGSSLCLQSDQKILAGGYTAVKNGTTVDFALARFNPQGDLDNTFGTGGKVIVDFQGGLDFGAAIALQNNGKIVMAGAARVGSDYDFGLARFNNDTALPVTLLSFEAKTQESDVLLSWKTAAEERSNYFEVQRSIAGQKWSILAKIESGHFTTDTKVYGFVDKRPIPGRYAYRLKMVDFDESFSYSSIAAVEVPSSLSSDSAWVYPNPTTGRVTLKPNRLAYGYRIEVFNSKGQLMNGFMRTGSELDLSPLPIGAYHIVAYDKSGTSESCKIIVGP